MNFPVLKTGAVAQYPITRERRLGNQWLRFVDGTHQRYRDSAGARLRWAIRLDYVDLTDDEAAMLEEFFGATEGSLNEFTFLDPAGNLLAWSGKLDADPWQKDPLLAITDGVTDPTGSTGAWRLSNSGGAGQKIAQTIAAPGGYLYCFSVYVRSAVPATVRLKVASETADRTVASGWG